jgi:hypothetical protein
VSGSKIYYNSGNIGIGATDPIAPLHIYNTSNTRLLLDATTTGTATVEFRRGIGTDVLNDYRFINDSSNSLKLQYENTTQVFGNTIADLAWFSSNETIIYKNTTFNCRVGIGTVYHATRSLDVLGDANVSGTVSVGGLSILSSNVIITNSLSSNTALTIQNGFTPSIPTEIEVVGATSTIIGSFDRVIMFPYSGTASTKDYTFTTTENLICDILIVGGGGGGGYGNGGGGGAGQLVLIHQATLNGTYNIKVGNGGTGGVYFGAVATKGSNSEFGNSSTTVIAEGGGANTNTSSDKDGGSGAGGDGYTSGGGTSGAGNAITTTDLFPTATVYTRGNNGGNQGGTTLTGGGGGGAGELGQLGSIGGKGGDGLSGITAINYDFQTNFGNFGRLEADGKYYFAGGGGGGGVGQTGAISSKGGGGVGGIGVTTPNNIGGNGIANTGSGGGGGGGNTGANGGNGGSGIVIIRYRLPNPSSSSSINFIRGTVADTNHDYKVGNFNGEFKVISSVFASASNIDTDYIRITTAGAITNPTGTANWNTGSDRRIKENIERASYDKCFENINRLELNRFNYVSGFNTVNRDKTQLGFIAQEVYDVFPKSISTQGYYSDTINIPDLLSIDISQINYSLYGAVKKLIEINNEKDSHLKALDDELKTIETILNITPTTSNLETVIISMTSNVILEEMTSNVVLEPAIISMTSNVILEEMTSNLVLEEMTSNVSNVSNVSNLVLEDMTSNVTSNLVLEEMTSNITVDS